MRLSATILLLAQLCASLCQAAVPVASGIAFYIVSDAPVEGGRFVNTTDLPNIGYVGSSSLVIQKIADVYGYEMPQESTMIGRDGTVRTETRTVFVVDMSLLPSDVGRFADLTESAARRRLLIEIDGVPICAPMVMSRIETKTVQMTLSSAAARDDAVRILEKYKGK